VVAAVVVGVAVVFAPLAIAPCLVYQGGADYDCYGGSGDGPYHTKLGVVYTVTASDPYGVDAGNDGKGCE
jgi:hypothetical protein